LRLTCRTIIWAGGLDIGSAMLDPKKAFNSRMLVTGASVLLAAGLATWSWPSNARPHFAGENFHRFQHTLRLPSFRHGILHPFRSGLLHPFGLDLHTHRLLHNSYPCSVFGDRPCIPYGTFCSVFSREPCLPDINYPIGQDLRLTIESRAEDDARDASPPKNDSSPPKDSASPAKEHSDRAPHELNTILDVFSALRACWVPPPKDEARSGTQMTVRLSFKRNGEMIAEPRVTYVTPGISPDVRRVYWDAVAAAFRRCTPLPFTDGLGGALAGRPFAVRFVDDRSL
jgi:hypothetical protein